MSSQPKIGLFGGTFDPPHMAHLIIAQEACDRLSLDRVLFVPAFVPPHKLDKTLSTFEHRLNMVRLAIEGNNRFEVLDIEGRMEPPSYTIRTLRVLHESYAKGPLATEFYLIVGSDSLLELESWREPEEILSLAHLAVFPRPSHSLEEAPISLIERIIRLEIPPLHVSSTLIRDRIRRGRSARYWTPHSVEDYVYQQDLYRNDQL